MYVTNNEYPNKYIMNRQKTYLKIMGHWPFRVSPSDKVCKWNNLNVEDFCDSDDLVQNLHVALSEFLHNYT